MIKSCCLEEGALLTVEGEKGGYRQWHCWTVYMWHYDSATSQRGVANECFNRSLANRV